ncbi:helix-turn-helix transcriptional regulator [Nonomuraea sp. NPDC050404]|uniref:helix-turn-helix transcriptional regulator n=1 Tax=Nonomuraea sp. NPDC050404 TaxID=3155783 RepID=UPI0033DC5B55
MEAPDLPLPDLLKHLREMAGLTQQQLADELCAITGTFTLTRHEIGRWEQGRVRPRAWLPSLADLLKVDLETLRRAPNRKAAAASYTGPSDDKGQVNQVLRRTFLQKTGAAAAALHRDSCVIQALDAITHDYLGSVVDNLGELIDHYALAICALPAEAVYDELLHIRSYASRHLDRAGYASPRAELVLAIGRLSHLLAVAACDMGQHAAARLWCSDARRCSREAAHPELAAWAALTQAMIAWYQGQPRQSAMLAAQARKSIPLGTAIHAKLASQEMRAAAMAGDVESMTRARQHAGRAIAALPGDVPVTGVYSVNLAEDPPYTATSLLFVGRYGEAVAAADRVISTVHRSAANQHGEQPSGYARSLLILGLAQAGLGRLDEAVNAGCRALAGSRPTWPTMVLAGKLDKTLTHDFPHARLTGDYHVRYLEAAGYPTGQPSRFAEHDEERR